MKALIILAYSLISVSCEKMLESPELVDPIYLDLLVQAKSMETLAIEEKKKVEELQKEIEKLPNQSGLKQKLEKKIFASQHKVDQSSQMSKYYKLSALKRKREIRKYYPIIFSKRESWPQNDVKKQYDAHKRLLNAPKLWDQRIPKLRQGASASDVHQNKKTKEQTQASH